MKPKSFLSSEFFSVNSKPCTREDRSPLNWEWEHDWGSVMVQDGETEG